MCSSFSHPFRCVNFHANAFVSEITYHITIQAAGCRVFFLCMENNPLAKGFFAAVQIGTAIFLDESVLDNRLLL